MHSPGCWFGLDEPIRSLLDLPTLRRLVSSCGDTLRTLFTKTLVTSLEELKLRIVVAIERATPQMLEHI